MSIIYDLNAKRTVLDEKLTNFISNTNITDREDKKRSINYLNWLSHKTCLVQQERTFVIPDEIDKKINRGAVAWIEFGFNLGREFGGRHPALIWRRTGESVFVIPLSSQTPTLIKKYHVKIDKVHNFSSMERWCNVLKIANISIARIDIAAAIGNVKGKILDDIGVALKNTSPY